MPKVIIEPRPDWTWENATPWERGMVVRIFSDKDHMSLDEVCEFFELTDDGAKAILKGDDWRPEYKPGPDWADNPTDYWRRVTDLFNNMHGYD